MLQNCKYYSARNIAALSNVIKKICNIWVDTDFFKKAFYSPYESALFDKTMKLRILSSHTRNKKLLGWSPSNFVPVIFVSPNGNQRRIETSNISLLKNDHCKQTIY